MKDTNKKKSLGNVVELNEKLRTVKIAFDEGKITKDQYEKAKNGINAQIKNLTANDISNPPNDSTKNNNKSNPKAKNTQKKTSKGDNCNDEVKVLQKQNAELKAQLNSAGKGASKYSDMREKTKNRKENRKAKTNRTASEMEEAGFPQTTKEITKEVQQDFDKASVITAQNELENKKDDKKKLTKAEKAEARKIRAEAQKKANEEAKKVAEAQKEEVKQKAIDAKISLMEANKVLSHSVLNGYCKRYARKIGKIPNELWLISFIAQMNLDNTLGKFRMAQNPLYKVIYDSLNKWKLGETLGSNISEANKEKIKEVAKYATPPTYSLIRAYIRIVKNADTTKVSALIARIERMQKNKIIASGMPRYSEVVTILKNLKANKLEFKEELKGIEKTMQGLGGFEENLAGLGMIPKKTQNKSITKKALR